MWWLSSMLLTQISRTQNPTNTFSLFLRQESTWGVIWYPFLKATPVRSMFRCVKSMNLLESISWLFPQKSFFAFKCGKISEVISSIFMISFPRNYCLSTCFIKNTKKVTKHHLIWFLFWRWDEIENIFWDSTTFKITQAKVMLLTVFNLKKNCILSNQ